MLNNRLKKNSASLSRSWQLNSPDKKFNSIVLIHSEMANNVDISIYDFDHICRTCLSRENLKPLYEKCVASICVVDMLTSCTFVKFAEDDGLPMKICTKCIHEINQAFSFATRCETSDRILRKCVEMKTVLANNSSQSSKIEEIMKIEVKPEIILPTVEQVLEDFEYVEVKQEEDVKTEFKTDKHRTEHEVLEEYVEEVKEEDEAKMDMEYVETYDNPDDEIYEDQNETYSVQSSSKDEDGSLPTKIKLHTRETHKVCGVCNKAFNRVTHLNDHMKIHTGEKIYSCGVCNITFTLRNSLNRHMRIHVGERSHVCDVCNKGFTQSNRLTEHMKIHTKTNVCTFCGKAYIYASSLKQHMRIHTGEKKTICPVCNKTFIRHNHLKVHMRVHTGEKPYSCEVCTKAFTQSSSLKQHMRKHIK